MGNRYTKQNVCFSGITYQEEKASCRCIFIVYTIYEVKNHIKLNNLIHRYIKIRDQIIKKSKGMMIQATNETKGIRKGYTGALTIKVMSFLSPPTTNKVSGTWVFIVLLLFISHTEF